MDTEDARAGHEVNRDGVPLGAKSWFNHYFTICRKSIQPKPIFVGSGGRKLHSEGEKKSVEERCREIDNRAFVIFNVVFVAFIAIFALFCML